MRKNNYDNYLGLEDIELGVLKSAFLTPEREYPLYTDVLSNEEKIEYIEKIQSLTMEQRRKKIIEQFNKIQNCPIENKKERDKYIEKETTYLILLLKSVPFSKKKDADYYWNSRYEYSKKEKSGKVLIEIAAAHPLINGKPKAEFEERLLQGIELYYYEKNRGNNPIIYIPGSLHYIENKENGEIIVDAEPLSEAGKNFLIEHGIPEKSIRANISNLDYKGEDGVYNSADECYVATQIARDENCKRIISIISPVTIYRKALIYNEFGFNPEIYAVGTEELNHNYIGETFWSLYITYMNDQDWQSGFLSFLTRIERDIDYPKMLGDNLRKIQNIIDNGKRNSIPSHIQTKRKVWMNLYNKAKRSMENMDKTKTDILIDLVRVNGREEFERKKIVSILKKNLEKNAETRIVILYNPSDDVEDIIELSKQYPAISLEGKGEKAEIINKFKNGHFRKFYEMYPSSSAMNMAIQYIINGIVPIVSTVPEECSNYVEQISSLLQEVLNPDYLISNTISNKFGTDEPR